MSAMTKKEWLASLQKAIDEFDWEAARESHSSTPAIDKSAAKRIATVLGWEPKRTPITDEDIRQANHHMVCGAYDYSFKQGVRWAEKVHGIKWEWEK